MGRYRGGAQKYLTFFTGATRPGRRGGAPPKPAGKPAESEYRNVRVFEAGGESKAKPLDFGANKPTGYGKGEHAKAGSVTKDGKGLHVRAAGGGWTGLKVALPYTVTAKTVVSLEFRTSVVGDVHAVGLDDNEELQQGWWPGLDWRTQKMYPEPAPSMQQVLGMLAGLRKEFSIDAGRLYVGGLSMGGYGTWDVIMRHPKMFAAAFPICGGGDVSEAGRIADLPIWNFHGDADGAVPVDRSRKMVAALKKAGSTKIRYSEYPGVGHNSWERASVEAELIPWLFSQKR